MNVQIFQALAEPSRFSIVELLHGKPRSVGEIGEKLHIRQPQVSKHLKVLSDAGLVAVHPDAQKRVYALRPETLKKLDTWLSTYRTLWEERFDMLALAIADNKKIVGRKESL